MKSTHVIAGATLALALPVVARAQEAGTTYTIQAGDTCAGISQRAYGDARLVDLIHGANRGMGPAPHRLVPGSTLVLPPKPKAGGGGPDAKLSSVRNKVEVQRPSPAPGHVNDPLFRGNRVGTSESSSAAVLFRDETMLQLGERTLVVILGDANAAAKRVSTAADTTLISGALRARLAARGEKKPAPLTVDTKAGRATVKGGEAKVHVDDKATTRVAVYAGDSSITAQKKTVDVTKGFGSKAEQGKPPEPPRPLPPAPRWTTQPPALAFVSSSGVATFTGELAAAPAGVSKWHLEVATDSLFDDRVLDVVVPSTVARVEARALAKGAYFLRVSAIDQDEFEGPASQTVAVQAGALRERLEGGAVRFEAEPASTTCSVDGAPAKPAAELALPPSKRYALRCGLAGSASGADYTTVSLVEPPKAPEPPPQKVEAPPPPPPREPIHFDVSLAAGGLLTSEGTATPGPRGVAGVGLVVPADNVALGVRLEAFLDHVSNHAPDAKLGGAPLTSASFTAVGLTLPVAIRFRGLGRVEPYVGLAPGVARVRADVVAASVPRSVDATRFVLQGLVGADVALGPGAVFGEIGVRGDRPLGDDAVSPSLAGGTGVVGYRLRWR